MLKFLVITIVFKVIIIANVALPYNIDNDSFNQKRIKRVVGGAPGKIEDFPFLVSISVQVPRTVIRLHLCGGSIITQNAVLTAAHCTNYSKKIIQTFKVRAGSSYWARDGILVNVEKIIQHYHFDSLTYENDIAILILSSILPFSKYISPISLATQLRPSGTYGSVMGWGLKNERGISPSQIFNIVDIPLIDLKQCQNIYYTSNLEKGVICAGYLSGGKDACNMDSGGPLIENGELIGIISLGVGCARPNRPGVYTDIVYKHFSQRNLQKINVSIMQQ
ncbi:trypsin alpha-3-like [Condylostylus longicornis]|uniref:trypsin alpha-3-like n=1 Tax=Condylostylus longicornis TaxID=2530218 RepID=UPI00244DE00A|nr:trypsin alpha-3-like [Condylostylus longicornis]